MGKAEREEKEKMEAKGKEMKRIASGKEMSDIRAAIQEQEIKKMAEQRRREKEGDRAAKAKVLAQIEADKAARRAEREAAKNPATASSHAAAAPPPVAAQPAVKKDYSEAKLQIRQTNGQPLVHSFGAKESLAAVRLYVQMNRTDGGAGQVKFMTNFPKKVFTDEEYENSLENLGLVPSAVLMVTK